MANLIEMVRQHPGKSAAEILDLLTAPTITKTNHSRINAADLMGQFGAMVVKSWHDALTQAGFGLAAQAIASTGLDFAHPETIKMLGQLGAAKVLDEATCQLLLKLGTWTESPWQAAGGSVDPTIEQIEAAQAAIAAETTKRELQDFARTRAIEIENRIGSGELKDLVAVKAAMGA